MQEQFIQERRYLAGVSEKTVVWYKTSFRAFTGALDSKQTIIGRIAELKAKGTSHITINSYLRCVNAYFRWLHIEHGKELVKIPKLKEEQKILETLNQSHLVALIHFRPGASANIRRAHMIALTILDTGLRASEVLGLTVENCDMENLVLKILGKGGKQRLVPFSSELRKSVYRFVTKLKPGRFVFGTKNDTQVSVHNLDRDFRILGKKLNITGVRFSPHTCRHSFAVGYLRNGGNLEFLRRILGHSSLVTTQKYLRSLGVEDLSAVHNRLSLLAR